jgi:hypothetical protein
MKPTCFQFLLVACSSFITYSAHARVIRVNNTGINCVNATDCYTSLSAAHTAALPGDTIHIEPSGTSYGNVTFSKAIVVLGNGYFLGNAAANGNDLLQVNTATSFCGNITVNSDADGIVIKGLNINILILLGSNAGNPLNNVMIIRNRIVNGGTCAWTNNLMFIGNYVGGTLNTGFSSNGNNANFYVGNNVLWNSEFETTDNGTFENNIVYGGSQPNAVVMYNATVQNNISTTQTTHTFGSCTVRNNIGRGSTNTTSYGTLNGNKNNIDPATVFVDFANSSTSYSTDSRWALLNGSPASGAGFGGTDCGIFGGNNMSYKLSGLPDIPSFYKLTVPASAGGSTMNITFSTRINN